MASEPAPGVHVTPIDAAEAEFVARLVRHIEGSNAAASTLIGEGSNNWVFRIESQPHVLKLCKPHRVAFAADENVKELWCSAAARAADVPAPKVIGHGTFEERFYQIQSFVDGRAPLEEERPLVWATMGVWAKALHAIPVSGWGPMFVKDGVFGGDWQAHIAYNVASLAPGDPLRALGVLDTNTSADLKCRFERLAATPFTFGLCHADLGLHNVLIDDHGALTLIDWGCATAAPVPHHEINEIVRANRATPEESRIFRNGYGLSAEFYAKAVPDMLILAVLRDVDTLRWAVDRKRDEIDRLSRQVRVTLARLYEGKI